MVALRSSQPSAVTAARMTVADSGKPPLERRSIR
jgi:hypothetical protein